MLRNAAKCKLAATEFRMLKAPGEGASSGKWLAYSGSIPSLHQEKNRTILMSQFSHVLQILLQSKFCCEIS